jgi:hypothetical protein
MYRIDNHSIKCRFNMEFYKLCAYKSDGICVDYQPNIVVWFCHYCREGFTCNLT